MADELNTQTNNTANAEQNTQNTAVNTQNNAETKTFTQEELDRIINERLERERKKYADYNDLKKAAEELQKIKESQMTEQEKLQAKLAEYERAMADRELELATLKAEQIKTKVLTEMGLPLSWSSRIFGTTEEEIKADAEELKKLLGVQGKTIGNNTNPPNGGNNTVDYRKASKEDFQAALAKYGIRLR